MESKCVIAGYYAVKEYNEVKSSLISMLEDLDDRLIKITENERLDGDTESLSQSSDIENDSVSVKNIANLKGSNENSEFKLTKEKGICKNCAGKISEERINSLPYTELCLKCAIKLEI